MSKTPILNLEMNDNDAGARTIKDYFKALLSTLLEEGESFSGKRPFGNSGWLHDLYKPLVRAKIINGILDDDGYIEGVDKSAALRYLLKAVKEL